MLTPCSNCFVFACSTEQEKDFYFTICFALWKAKAFHPHLCGSVIEFITIREFKNIVDAAAEKLQSCRQIFSEAVVKVKAIEEKEKTIRQQLLLLSQLKVAILRQFLK